MALVRKYLLNPIPPVYLMVVTTRFSWRVRNLRNDKGEERGKVLPISFVEEGREVVGRDVDGRGV